MQKIFFPFIPVFLIIQASEALAVVSVLNSGKFGEQSQVHGVTSALKENQPAAMQIAKTVIDGLKDKRLQKRSCVKSLTS